MVHDTTVNTKVKTNQLDKEHKITYEVHRAVLSRLERIVVDDEDAITTFDWEENVLTSFGPALRFQRL